MAHPRAHPPGGGRGALYVRRRLDLPARHGQRARRHPGAAAGNGLLKLLRRRHACSRRQSGGAVRPDPAICPRAGDFRRVDAVLRLALSTVLSFHRRHAGPDALRRRACGVAGDDARPLPAGDARDPRDLDPHRFAHSKRADLGPALAPARARLPRRPGQCRSRPERPPHRGTHRRRAGCIGPQADRRRHPIRPPGLYAAIRSHDPCRPGSERTLAHLFVRRRNGCAARGGGHARYRLERMVRVPGIDALYAPRRARTGRSRLVQDAKRVRLGTHVGGANLARLRAPRRNGGRPRRRVDRTVAKRNTLLAQGRGSVSPRSSRPHSRSTTT